MSNFLMFVMIAALFIHTFLNFLTGVYAAVVKKLSAIQPVVDVVSSVEDVVGKVVAWAVGSVKKLLG